MAAPMEADAFHHVHPGAAPFGNFINYYSFNPPEKRIKFLPNELLNVISNMSKKRNVTVLDIGCNAGDLTVALYKHLIESQQCGNQQIEKSSCKASAISSETDRSTGNNAAAPELTGDLYSTLVNVLGCDIDEKLITRANDSNIHPENITFSTMDFMCDTSRNSILTSFLSTNSEMNNTFDLVCCFSITMWIHLQHGDAGLHRFLKEASVKSRFLLVEPQPWKCYKSAVRRVKKVGIENSWRFKELTMRDQVDEEIRNYLTSHCQMELIRTLGETHWERKLLLFRNIQDTESQ